jgi:hypothetical protein
MPRATYVCEPDPACLDPHPSRWYCMRGHDGAEPGVCLLRCCGGPGLADWQVRGFDTEAAMKAADAKQAAAGERQEHTEETG